MSYTPEKRRALVSLGFIFQSIWLVLQRCASGDEEFEECDAHSGYRFR